MNNSFLGVLLEPFFLIANLLETPALIRKLPRTFVTSVPSLDELCMCIVTEKVLRYALLWNVLNIFLYVLLTVAYC
jgi:hypothetical protein